MRSESYLSPASRVWSFFDEPTSRAIVIAQGRVPRDGAYFRQLEPTRRVASDPAAISTSILSPFADAFRLLPVLFWRKTIVRQAATFRLRTLSASVVQDDTLEHGFDCHLVKPVDPDYLACLIGEVAPASQARRTTAAPFRPGGRKGKTRSYCLSNTAVLVDFLPFASVE
jgi:hypothetical protein